MNELITLLKQLEDCMPLAMSSNPTWVRNAKKSASFYAVVFSSSEFYISFEFGGIEVGKIHESNRLNLDYCNITKYYPSWIDEIEAVRAKVNSMDIKLPAL